jgi:hypothetical protein
VIRVYDESGNVIETHKHARAFSRSGELTISACPRNGWRYESPQHPTNRTKKVLLEPSSALNQVNNQHDNRDNEQEVNQAPANMADEAKKPEHDQDDNYSPEHKYSFRLS